MKKQQGSSFVQVFLLIVLAAIVAGTGYYVWLNRDINLNSSNIVPTSSISNFDECVAAGNPIMESYPEQCAADGQTFVKEISSPIVPTENEVSTKGWSSYTSNKGAFSLKFPPKWVQAEEPELCNDDLILLAQDKSSIGKCASDGYGQVSISASRGDIRKDLIMGGDQWFNLKTESVNVDGVKGSRTEGNAQKQLDNGWPGGLEDGTLQVLYVFYTNDKTYVARYSQSSQNVDVQAEFRAIVEQTLAFGK